MVETRPPRQMSVLAPARRDQDIAVMGDYKPARTKPSLHLLLSWLFPRLPKQILAGDPTPPDPPPPNNRNAARPHLLLAFWLLVSETILALQHDVPLLPIGVCILGFTTVLSWAFWQKSSDVRLARRLALLLLLKLVVVAVAVTHGVMSPVMTFLIIPLLFAALFVDARTTFVLAGVITGVLVVNALAGGSASETASAELVRDIVVVIFALAFTVSTTHMNRGFLSMERRAREQQVRAERQQARAEEQEARAQRATQLVLAEEARISELTWLHDSARMMESLPSLEEGLAAALLTLRERITFDYGAFYVWDNELVGEDSAATGDCLRCVQDFGRRHLPAKNPNVLCLTEAESRAVRGQVEAVLWAGSRNTAVAGELLRDCNTNDTDEAFATLAHRIQPDTQSALIIPLQMLDDAIGFALLFSDKANVYTKNQCELVERLAQHIIYPIQRLRLQTLATTDVLTGLVNQRDFRRRLRQEAERARRYTTPLSLILMDVDRFKRVNDTHGHRAGDAVLAHIGALLRRCVRGIDIAARYGGEEMAIICPETDTSQAAGVAERLRAALEEAPIRLPSGESVAITASFGIAEAGKIVRIPSRDGNAQSAVTAPADEVATLIEFADRALLEAKATGRNRVQVAA